MKCSRRGAKKKGVWREGQRETWTGFKVPRRNEQLEVKSALGGVWLCVHVLSVYRCLFTCLLITNMPEDLHKRHLQKISICHLTVSTYWNEIVPQSKTLRLFSFLKPMYLLNVRNPYSNLDHGFGLATWLSPCSMHELWWKLNKCRTFTKCQSKLN